jgi:hypothetical protein
MVKKIVYIGLFAMLLGFAPAAMYAQTEKAGVEVELGAITISISENTLHIQNAAGEMLQIYNLTGVKVATYRIDSQDKTLTLSLPKGCYILQIGKVARKVSVR